MNYPKVFMIQKVKKLQLKLDKEVPKRNLKKKCNFVLSQGGSKVYCIVFDGWCKHSHVRRKERILKGNHAISLA